MNFNIFSFFFGGGGGGGGGFKKYFFFLKILWIFLGVITKLTGFRGHFYAFKDLFKWPIYRMGIFFGVAKLSFFLCMSDIPDIWEGGVKV